MATPTQKRLNRTVEEINPLLDKLDEDYTKAEIDTLIAAKQDTIDSSHKLSSDLVDDTNNTHKFATAAQLQQIETNKNNILSIHADWPTYAIRDNTTSFTFNVPANGKHFRYGLLIGGTSAANLYFNFIYIGANDAVTLFDVIGRASTAISASYSNGVLRITASGTIYGGLRLIWLD